MIVFRGATQTEEVIIRHTASVGGGFTIDNNGNLSGSLVDIEAIDAVAHWAAILLSPKRGASPGFIENLRVNFNALLEQLATSATRASQLRPVRMRGYRSGRIGRWMW